METKTQINPFWSLVTKTVGEFTVDELNVIFNNLYKFTVYSKDNNYFIVYDLDNCKQLNKNCNLFYYLLYAELVSGKKFNIEDLYKIENISRLIK